MRQFINHPPFWSLNSFFWRFIISFLSLNTNKLFIDTSFKYKQRMKNPSKADPCIREWVWGSKKGLLGAYDALLVEVARFGGRRDSILGRGLPPFSSSVVSMTRSPVDGGRIRTSLWEKVMVGKRKFS